MYIDHNARAVSSLHIFVQYSVIVFPEKWYLSTVFGNFFSWCEPNYQQ